MLKDLKKKDEMISKKLEGKVSKLRETGQLDNFKKVWELLPEDKQEEASKIINDKGLGWKMKVSKLQAIFIRHVGPAKMRKLVKGGR